MFFSPISLEQLKKEVKSLDTKKATTSKNIPVKHLQVCLDVCSHTLHQIINESLTINNKFPDEFKLAEVTPVFKSEEKSNAKNYRPISVLPTVSKLLERIMENQITSHLESYLSPYLCGYRKGYSTQHALVSLIEKWKVSRDKGGCTGAILMDLSKAFDTLNHDLLVEKLHAYGFSHSASNLIKDYLT